MAGPGPSPRAAPRPALAADADSAAGASAAPAQVPDRSPSLVVGRLSRRLDALRAERDSAEAIRAAIESDGGEPIPRGRRPIEELAAALATSLGGAVVETPRGRYVRCDHPSLPIPIDRERLATLPSMPGTDAPLLCLDTETTGLGTATGTAAFLIGLGWWTADRFTQVQLALPDMSEEAAFLAAFDDVVPPGGVLVSYNGRAFDWPLLVTRYRLMRRDPPGLGGHLDLLFFVRRVFRHRLTDARLQTVETELLAAPREPDVFSWQIPSLFQEYLRTGHADPLADVARHNREDVASLGRLLAFAARRYGDRDAWPSAPSGDLIGLARLIAKGGDLERAIDCLATARVQAQDLDSEITAALTQARLLRRAGRTSEAVATWHQLARMPGPAATLALVELAKHVEHRERDVAAALRVTDAAIARHHPAVWGAATRDEVRLGRELALRRSRLLKRLAVVPRSLRLARRAQARTA